jgi:hypothetical protein
MVLTATFTRVQPKNWYQQIILALNILSGSVITITPRDRNGEIKVIDRSAYLPHLAAVLLS